MVLVYSVVPLTTTCALYYIKNQSIFIHDISLISVFTKAFPKHRSLSIHQSFYKSTYTLIAKNKYNKYIRGKFKNARKKEKKMGPGWKLIKWVGPQNFPHDWWVKQSQSIYQVDPQCMWLGFMSTFWLMFILTLFFCVQALGSRATLL